MNRDGELTERADELDRLIEEQRSGVAPSEGGISSWAGPLSNITAGLDQLGRDASLPDADALWERLDIQLSEARESAVAETLEDLASSSVVARLDALARGTVPPDEEAVWARVASALPDRDARESWWRIGPFGRKPRLWGPLGAAAAVLIAVVLMLAQPPTNSAEAFVRDVEALSAIADQALFDGLLTETEKEAMAERAAALRTVIDERPEILVELDDRARGHVLETLASVSERLTPLADEELEALRSYPPGPETALEVGGDGQSSAPQPGGPSQLSEGDPARGADGSEPGLRPQRSESTSNDIPGLTQVAPVVASSVRSLHEVADRVDEAARGNLAPTTAGTPGQLAGLCRDLRGAERSDCQRAINEAVAACSGAAGRGALDDCGEAVETASAVCEAVLSNESALRCTEALAALTDGLEWEASGGSSGWDRGRIGQSASDDDDNDGRDRRSDDRRDREGD